MEAARVAEIAATDSSTSSPSDDVMFGQLLNEMSASRRAAEQNTAEIQRLASRLAASSVNTVQRPTYTNRPSSPRRVTFSDDSPDTRRRTPPPAQQYCGRTPYQPGRQQHRPQRVPPRSSSPHPLAQDCRPSTLIHTCGNCGGSHQFGSSYCRAFGVVCHNCKRSNHLARMCRSGRRSVRGCYQNT